MKTCETCGAYRRIYRKYGTRFFADRFHYCIAREEKTKQNNTCECRKPKTRRFDLSPERFDRAEENVRRISELLDEPK